jgi:hypothetical protein
MNPSGMDPSTLSVMENYSEFTTSSAKNLNLAKLIKPLRNLIVRELSGRIVSTKLKSLTPAANMS